MRVSLIALAVCIAGCGSPADGSREASPQPAKPAPPVAPPSPVAPATGPQVVVEPRKPDPSFAELPRVRGRNAQMAFATTVLKGDRQEIAAMLAPELTATHGEAAVVDALLRHVQRFGPGGFKAQGPLMLPDEFIEADGRLTITTRGDRDRVTVGVDIRGPTSRLLSLRIVDIEDKVQLDLTPGSITSLSADFVPVPTPPRTVLTTRRSVQAGDRHFMLARRGGELCAFQLHDLQRAERKFGRYDAYVKKLGDPTPMAKAKHRSGELTSHDPVDDQVPCGTMAIQAGFEGYVIFDDDLELYLAPTHAETITEVDPDAPDLVWLSYGWGRHAYDPAADAAAKSVGAEPEQD